MLFILGQVPQISEAFKEEKQGMDAAYGKAQRAYATANDVYTKTRSEVEIIQSRLDTTKQDIDKGVAYTKDVGEDASKYYDAVQSLVNGVKGMIDTPSEDNAGASPVNASGEKASAASQN